MELNCIAVFIPLFFNYRFWTYGKIIRQNWNAKSLHSIIFLLLLTAVVKMYFSCERMSLFHVFLRNIFSIRPQRKMMKKKILSLLYVPSCRWHLDFVKYCSVRNEIHVGEIVGIFLFFKNNFFLSSPKDEKIRKEKGFMVTSLDQFS